MREPVIPLYRTPNRKRSFTAILLTAVTSRESYPSKPKRWSLFLSISSISLRYENICFEVIWYRWRINVFHQYSGNYFCLWITSLLIGGFLWNIRLILAMMFSTTLWFGIRCFEISVSKENEKERRHTKKWLWNVSKKIQSRKGRLPSIDLIFLPVSHKLIINSDINLFVLHNKALFVYNHVLLVHSAYPCSFAPSGKRDCYGSVSGVFV